MKILDFYGPMKNKVVRGNNVPFMNKKLCKAIMLRSRLKNKFNKNPNEANRNYYKKQRNVCGSFARKEKKRYYNKLYLKIFEDNKKFWRCKAVVFKQTKNLR